MTRSRAYQLTQFDYKTIAKTEKEIGKVGPYDVLVKMKAASLNFRDLLIAQGLYNPNLKLPLVPLSDGSGEVIEVGERVSRFRPGDRVATTFMQDWLSGPLSPHAVRSALGGEIDGVLQNQKIFPEGGLVKVPEHLSFNEAASLPCAAVTAWNALFEAGSIRPGDKVLVMGSGGVSVFALQFARAAGAYVFATSSSDEKLERLKSLGANQTINYKITPDWDKAILKATDNLGVDHIVEVGGAATLDKSINAIKLGGHISVIGVLAGMGKIDPIKVLMKAIRLQGIFVGSKEMFENMNQAITANQIKPVIDKKTFPVDKVSDAIDFMHSGSHFGKIVLEF
ncbi:MAG: NAD(P)-dependent alcohol dehydrogenase [Candidatus Obscuribacterales bacterium]|nr:NAD(P)-dependent alcohol dehydrogenase [Candidatus Obscuribacterales bacterium]